MDREADVGGILSQTVEVVGSAGRAVLVYTLVLGMLAGVGGLFGLVAMDDTVWSRRIGVTFTNTDTLGLASGAFETLSLIVFVIASYLLLRQMMVGLGRTPAPGSRFWSFLGMSILALIGLGLGFMLFVIPGIILLVKWSAANGYVMTGEHGIRGSLGASWEATSGHGWSILGAGVILWIAMAILSGMLVGVLFGVGMQNLSGAFQPLTGLVVALSGFVESFTNAVSFAFSIAVFHLLAPADTSVADVFE